MTFPLSQKDARIGRERLIEMKEVSDNELTCLSLWMYSNWVETRNPILCTLAAHVAGEPLPTLTQDEIALAIRLRQMAVDMVDGLDKYSSVRAIVRRDEQMGTK